MVDPIAILPRYKTAMTLGYSSMGQPELSFEQCCHLADEFGLDFIELRVLEDSLNLPEYFQSREVSQTRIPVQVLGSSLQLIGASRADMDDFIRFAHLAGILNAPYIRVFGGRREGDSLSPEEFNEAAATINLIRKMAIANGWHFEILLETHSVFSTPQYCQELNALLPEPVNLVWDSHHTWKITGESPAQTWDKLSPWIRHVHYKDSITENDTYRYVLPGEGEFPSSMLLNLLSEKRYQGGISLEWEKLWHRELPPLRNALEKFVRLAKSSG